MPPMDASLAWLPRSLLIPTIFSECPRVPTATEVVAHRHSREVSVDPSCVPPAHPHRFLAGARPDLCGQKWAARTVHPVSPPERYVPEKVFSASTRTAQLTLGHHLPIRCQVCVAQRSGASPSIPHLISMQLTLLPRTPGSLCMSEPQSSCSLDMNALCILVL